MSTTLTHLAAEELRAARKLLQDDEGLAIVLRSIKLKEEVQYQKNEVWGACRESLKNEDEAQDASKVSSHNKVQKRKIMLSFKDFCESLGVYQRLPERLVLAQNVFCANTALSKYNKEHNRDYKLVELLVSARYVAHVAGFHCNFRAVKSKKLDDSSGGGGVGCSPKLFFADIVVADGNPRKIHCCIVKRRTAAKAGYNCCENCPPSLIHCSCDHDHDLYRASHSLQVEAARKALYLYNKGRRPRFQYELVEPVSCNSTYNGVTCDGWKSHRFHSNFTAKLKSPHSSDNASPRLFFAEFLHSTGSIIDVRCYTLDCAKDLVDHCWFCRDGVLHPANYRFPSAPRA